jgi:arsenite methyltransferase
VSTPRWLRPLEVAFDDPALVSSFDELPLWSAPFGLALLDTVRLRPDLTALDVGCGTGFPLIELAQRLGSRSRVFGLDPWKGALSRAKQKLRQLGLENVALLDASAERIPLGAGSVDLVVSNNGLNNVQDLDAALGELARVSGAGAQLVFTFNLPETMREVYEPLSEILHDDAALGRLRDHVFSKRKPVGFMREQVERAGFEVAGVREDRFALRFADGTAMFEHFFMRLAFIPPWLELVEEPRRIPVFLELEKRLNAAASALGGLALSVPFACFDCRRR